MPGSVGAAGNSRPYRDHQRAFLLWRSTTRLPVLVYDRISSREGDMKRRQFISLLGGAVVAYPLGARAQQSDQLRRIGVLMATFEGDPAGESRLAAFRAELAKLGWTEGRNLRIDVRWGADADAAQLERYAADLIALGPDVLVSEANQPTAALRSQTRTIPIVFMGVADPAGQGTWWQVWRTRGATSQALPFLTLRWQANGWRC